MREEVIGQTFGRLTIDMDRASEMTPTQSDDVVQPVAPNESGSSPVVIRWIIETPAGWLGAWDRGAFDAYLSQERTARLKAEAENELLVENHNLKDIEIADLRARFEAAEADAQRLFMAAMDVTYALTNNLSFKHELPKLQDAMFAHSAALAAQEPCHE